MSPLLNVKESDYEPIYTYIGNESVKHNIKFEEQKNEINKSKVLQERSRYECLRMVSSPQLTTSLN